MGSGRNLAIRQLHIVGCPVKNIGRVIKTCADVLGVPLLDVPSARTVGRIILEGGVVADVQLVFEFMNVECGYLTLPRAQNTHYSIHQHLFSQVMEHHSSISIMRRTAPS